MTERSKHFVFGACLLLLLALVAECAAFGAGKFLQAMYKMYSVPAIQHGDAVASYADYLRVRDPRLGWPFSVPVGGDRTDASGARYSPAFPDPQAAANVVSVFGDSYAAGSEVDDEHAWANQLALNLRARVGNFGVPGYGTDQAYMRSQSLQEDPSRVVILTNLSEDIVRHLTRDWDLVTHLGYYGMKPRFVLDAAGALVPVPVPDLSEHDYRRSVGLDQPFLPVENENFQPGGPAGVTGLTFPYTVSVLRNLGSYQMRSVFARRPDYAEFYRKGHPMQGLEITAKIIEAFQRDVRKAGKTPLVILLATRHDITYVRRTGQWTYASLNQELDGAKVDYIDFGPTLLKHMGDRPVTAFFQPLGHYNEDVSKLLADTVYAALAERGVVPRQGAAGPVPAQGTARASNRPG